MVRGDAHYYIGDYGVCESIPKSLMIGLLTAHTRERVSSVMYQGLENAKDGTYDRETLEHLIAVGASKTCIKNIETVKFPTRWRNYNEKMKVIEAVLNAWEVGEKYLDRWINIERAHYDLTYLFWDKL